MIKLISLFSGAGGLDLGFKKAGFSFVFSNEYDKNIWDTYKNNFPEHLLLKKSIIDIFDDEIPNVDGLIGGPPCQSWSEAGSSRGIDDKRGQLFFEYIRVLKKANPKFFLAENVSGILFNKHNKAFSNIIKNFECLGYNVSYFLLNTNNYGVPQDRERVIIVGYEKSYNMFFEPPVKEINCLTLKDAIFDLKDSVVKPKDKNKHNPDCIVLNHEYMIDSFSSMYMSRNRVRSWDEPSFTIQASGRHAPLHPQAPKMQKIAKDKMIFVKGQEDLYRRLSVRECARIQTFPDNFEFQYDKVQDGYKMIGNAVPVEFAFRLAKKIKEDLKL